MIAGVVFQPISVQTLLGHSRQYPWDPICYFEEGHNPEIAKVMGIMSELCGRLARPLVQGPIGTKAAAVDGNTLHVISLKVARADYDPVNPRYPPIPSLSRAQSDRRVSCSPLRRHRPPPGDSQGGAPSHTHPLCLCLARAEGAQRGRRSARSSTRGWTPRQAWRRAPGSGGRGGGRLGGGRDESWGLLSSRAS